MSDGSVIEIQSGYGKAVQKQKKRIRVVGLVTIFVVSIMAAAFLRVSCQIVMFLAACVL